MDTNTADFGVPSERQRAWHWLEMYGFVHFTINTFTDREWGYGDESPERFAPAQLDCDQWVAAAKAAGLGGLILTAKHHDGFCLWPTKTTDHNITRSPFRRGQGDLVRELSDACRRGGIKFGIYCSPWDRNHAEYAREGYVQAFHAQWRELLTGYGPLFEVWLDGANGGDGYYGGARETRSIDPATYYRYDELRKMIRELQGDAIIHGGAHSDVRWCGNEMGFTSFTNWCTVAVDDALPQGERDLASISGTPGGSVWRPAEVDVSIRRGWFWHPKERPHDAASLFDIWLASVGRGAGLLLNLAPDRDGLIPPEDFKTLVEFGNRVRSFTAVDLARGCAVTSPQDDSDATGRLVDGDANTNWQAPGVVAEVVIELCRGVKQTYPIAGVRLEEDIRHGQRVSGWAIDVRAWRSWFEVARGTTIGPHRIVRLEAATADAVRLRILDAVAPPVLRGVAVYAGADRMH